MAEHQHEHEHEHHHHHVEMPQKSKYEEALAKYNLDITDEEVKAAVKKIIAEKVHENDTLEVKRFMMGSVELTTLKTTDSDESVLAFTERVNQFDTEYPDLPHVATISQALIEVKTVETALALKDGATEIDMVQSVGAFLSGDYETVCDEIQQMKETCGDHKLKVILETGCLKTAANIKTASILAMYSGADYIKTSTGKLEPAATPEAAYVMCQAIKEYYDETGIQIGFKPAGGLNSVMDALIYYTIVKEVLGEKWLTNQWFRMGTDKQKRANSSTYKRKMGLRLQPHFLLL